MVRTAVKLLLIDAILLAAVSLVLSDIKNRLACASGEFLYGQGCLARDSPSYTYSFLTRYFTMVSSGSTLTSPPTLDWVQVLIIVLAAVNLAYIFAAVRDAGRKRAVLSGKEMPV